MIVDKIITDDNGYKPTPAEIKLLEVLINPEYLGKNVTDICEVAGISRFKYYEAMKKDGFQELVNDMAFRLVKGKIADVLNATYTYAMGEKGHQDRKMLLTMAGLYVDKKESEVKGTLGLTVNDKRVLADQFITGLIDDD